MDIKARFSTKVEPCFDCCSRGINRYYELKIIVGEDSVMETAYEIKDTEYEQHFKKEGYVFFRNHKGEKTKCY